MSLNWLTGRLCLESKAKKLHPHLMSDMARNCSLRRYSNGNQMVISAEENGLSNVNTWLCNYEHKKGLQVWDLRQRNSICTFEEEFQICSVAFSAAGDQVSQFQFDNCNCLTHISAGPLLKCYHKVCHDYQTASSNSLSANS